jgi:hypothetical protein
VEPLLLDLTLLRALETPHIHLTPGRALMARVIERQPNGQGALSVAGARLEATLPAHVKPGDELRLVVREVTDNKLVLTMSDPAQVNPGMQLREDEQRVDERETGGQSAPPGAETASLRYNAPTLRMMDLRFAQAGETLSVTIALAAGQGVTDATQASQQLIDALSQATGRQVSVAVVARRDPVDLYA